jgi:tetratricopeptide (TPR) repeat protein
MVLHAFVAMPFGVKEGVDFNAVYADYIKPALEGVGFEVFRADEERRAGNIRTDMFQELLLADLVVVDLSLDNPNVWYELGVRHGLRSRGVIQIQCKREYLPFDVYVDRTLRYHVKDGTPDPQCIAADRKALAAFAKETIDSWRERKVSPVYHLLRFLREPDWRSLRVEEAREFWGVYEAWEERVEVARRMNRPGDILVLAGEIPTRLLRVETYRRAGKALLSLGQFAFALEQYEKALALDPDDRESRQRKGLLLGRLKRSDEAREWLNAVTQDHPGDAEGWGLLGRVIKEEWIDTWHRADRTPDQMRQEAAHEEARLREAIEPYARGFRKDPRHYYSGINAVALMHVLRYLVGGETAKETADRHELEGGVRWAVRSALEKDPKDYWARVTLADLELLTGEKAVIERAYRAAAAVAEKDWFALDSSRRQVQFLKDLLFRPTEVDAALKIFDRELDRLGAPTILTKPWTPRLVFLFSGHMIDAPDRAEPRFPADKESVAAKTIAEHLARLGAGPEDLAICGGACGGDLLFAEACLARGLRLSVHIPFAEPRFLPESVTFADAGWRDRYYQVKANPLTKLLVMANELGPSSAGVNAFARNNMWQLNTALTHGPEKVRFLCLWNRQGGDGPGGTRHMHDTVLQHSGQVYVLDTTKLW